MEHIRWVRVDKNLRASTPGGKVLFLARVPSIGYAVYDVREGKTAAPSSLRITNASLENARYRIRIDDSGDLAEIYDRVLQKDLLSAEPSATCTDRQLRVREVVASILKRAEEFEGV